MVKVPQNETRTSNLIQELIKLVKLASRLKENEYFLFILCSFLSLIFFSNFHHNNFYLSIQLKVTFSENTLHDEKLLLSFQKELTLTNDYVLCAMPHSLQLLMNSSTDLPDLDQSDFQYLLWHLASLSKRNLDIISISSCEES